MAEKARSGGVVEEKERERERGVDSVYRFDAEAINAQRKARPWDAESDHNSAPPSSHPPLSHWH